jgi:hypothetical protein
MGRPITGATTSDERGPAMSAVGGGSAPFRAGQSGRSVPDVLRRGLDSTIANWPILLLRLAETMVVAMLVIATVLVVVVPLAISIGLSAAGLQETFQRSDSPGQLLASLFAAHWLILVYILVAVSLALLVVVGVHSFVMAGSARTFVEADRAAGGVASPRQQFAVFSIERWVAGGSEAWWPVFWIYNLAYGIAGIVILLPLLPIAILIALLQHATAAIVLSCLGLLIVAFVAMIVLIVTNIVCQKAIVIAAQRRIDGMTALRKAWHAMRADFGRHFAVAFIMMVLLFGGTGVLTMVSFGFAVPAMTHSFAGLMFMPMRLLTSFASSVFSAMVGNWFMASYAALSSEGA